MSERTPGTWHADLDMEGTGWLVYAEGEGGWHDTIATDLTEADAKLIARAPELAEAQDGRRRGEIVLCPECGGDTTLKIPGGTETYPDCDGIGWAP